MPEQMQWLNDEAQPFTPRRVHAEHRLLGYTYAEVGAGFAKRWEFPRSIVDAVAHQLHPFADETYEPMAGIVHLSAWRARAREEGLSPGKLADTFPDEVALILGIDINEVLMNDAVEWTTGAEASAMV
jgi:HD-like signal output (HDOD) protein